MEWNEAAQKWEIKESSNKGDGNQLSKLPAALSNLKALRVFICGDWAGGHWPISDISPLSDLTALNKLVLYNNQISDITPLAGLAALNSVYLSRNEISDIIPLARLTALNKLDLHNNQISDITPLAGLTALNNLYLNYNQISDITPLAGLTALNELVLSYNEISDVSSLLPLLQREPNPLVLTIEDWYSINDGEIKIGDNPLQIPPIEVVKQGREAALRWLEEYMAKDNEPLQEAKLLILGAGGVGKTSLMYKLRNPNAALPAEADTTVGISVVAEPVAYNINNSTYTLSIWDFGGQDVYHPTHQLFLTKNSLYVLMEDGRQKKTDFYYWLQVQELLAGNSPLLIVQNIRNKSRSEIAVQELRGKFGNIKEYFEVDLSEVDDKHREFMRLVAELQTKLQSLPHIGEMWPRKRYQIRAALLNKKNEQYISLRQYRQLCNEHQYTETVRQDDLLQQLHILGVVLHFADEPFLRDTVITDPQWATKAIYAILDHTERHHEKKGHFTHDDLCGVWHDECYEGKFAQLLKLMEKFELAFPLSDAPNTYITPLLLPNDKPAYDWDKAHSLQLRYAYDFMPKGILARLIVRKHDLLKDHLFWKRGAIFHRNATEAEIREDYEGRNLFISIKGDEAREMMYEISSEIDRINSTYHFSERIQVRKQVPCICHTCKGAANPHFYDYKELKKRQENNKKTIECQRVPYEDVTVTKLLEESGVERGTGPVGDSPVLLIFCDEEDRKDLKTLKDHLSPLTRDKKLQICCDQDILAGSDWEAEMAQYLQKASAVALLISADFLADNKAYFWEKAMPVIEKRQQQGQIVIPIIVRECNWDWDEQLAKIQAVNGGKALNSAADKDEAFNAAAQQIKQAIVK